MAKQLNIDLRVNADIKQAKQAMAELEKKLDSIITSRTINVEDKSINEAKQAAIDLKRHLEEATNVQTGKINLSKFSSSLKQSGQNLQGLYNKITQIGPAGQGAFLSLAQSVAKADTASINLKSKLGGLLVTLKNTAKWQISSSILHGFMGAIQGAYGYAQDLNESLNNIRIVTGQNIDQMSKFAAEANKAAKALSTSTTSYTDAALIYYQQGLNDEEVKERTNATIKLANVSRQSAEEVSSQMTAIWNNFKTEGKTVEYYADVITSLGASTASSSSEIAEGLSKFASVADTVGLSYEKASAALATVVAETRQSADVVGTAFKTIFARLEGLQLGETLEDNVDLNKYSKALAAIGVNILDANGQIKSMNDILDETGAKWENIGKEQQIALAQTVAGTRQYTQFISLMDNYNKVQKNETLATSSEGTLQKQADTYAESWEAASKKVNAALQSIYEQLINDKAFIQMLNGIEKFISMIGNIIQGLGGIKGILLTVGSIFMQYYAKEMPAFLQKTIQDLRILSGSAEKTRVNTISGLDEIIQKMTAVDSSKALNGQLTGMQTLSKMYLELAQKRRYLSSTEVEAYEQKIKEIEAYKMTAEAIGKEVDELKKEQNERKNKVVDQLRESGFSKTQNLNKLEDQEQQEVIKYLIPEINKDSINKTKKEIEKAQEEINKAKQQKNKADDELQTAYGEVDNAFYKYGFKTDQYNEAETNFNKKSEEQKKAQNKVKELEGYLEQLNNKLNKVKNSFSGKDLLKGLEDSAQKFHKIEIAIEATSKKTTAWKRRLEEIGENDSIEDITKEMQDYVKKLQEAGVEVGDLDDKIKKLAQNSNDEQALKDVQEGFKQALSVETEGNNYDKMKDKVNDYREALISLGVEEHVLDELIEKFKQGELTEEQFSAALKKLEEQQDTNLTHTVKFSEGLMQFASVCTQVVSIVNAFQNLGSIWENEDLSTGEKVIQTLSAVGTLIPALISVYKTLNMVKAIGSKLSLKDAAASGADAVAKGTETVATEGTTAAQWSLNEAIAANPVGAFVAILAALIAIFAAVTIAVLAFADAETEEQKQLRLANEELERSKTVAQEAKQAYENLKNAVSNYDSALEALEKCTKGTQEWRDAFKEVLAQASELIATYPELLKQEDLYKDGLLNQEALHKAVESKETLSLMASANVVANQAKVHQTKYQLDLSNVIKTLRQTEGLHEYVQKEEPGGGTTRTRISKTFTTENGEKISAEDVIEDIAKEAIANNLNYFDKENVDNFIKSQLKEQNINSDEINSASTIINEALISTSGQLENLGKEADNLSNEMYNAAQILFDSYFKDKEFKDVNEEVAYQQAFNEENKKIDNEIEKAQRYADALKDYHSAFLTGQKTSATFKLIEGKNNGDLVAYNNLIKTYSDQNPNSKYTGVTVKDGNLLVKEEGVKEEDWKPIQEVLAEIKPVLQEKARQDIEEKGSSIYNSMDKTRTNAAAYVQVKGNFDEVSYEELQESFFKNGKIDFSQITEEAKESIAEILKIDKDQVEGYLTKTINTYTAELDKIPDYLNDHLNKNLIEKINLGSLEEVGEMYTNILASSGEVGLQTLDNIVAEAGAKAPQVLEVLANTDFSTQTVDQINASFKSLGINFHLTEGQVYSLRQALISNFNMSLETAQETVKSISSIISKLKNQGDIIEQKDYDTLMQLNPTLDTFFTTLADGTHMLTGEIQDFKKAVQSSTMGQLYLAKQNQEDVASAYNSLSNDIVSSDQLGGFDELFQENKGKFGAWEKYEDQARAQIKVLQDNGEENKKIATELLAQIESGKDLDDVVYKAAKAYEDLNLSSEEFTQQAEEAAKKVQEIADAIKETQYQFDIQNAGLDYDTTENYANVLMDLYEAEGLTKDGARALAIANQRLDRGLSSLNDNFETWTKSLKNTSKASAEYAKTIGEIRDSFADLLNVADTNELSLKWIEQWANDAEKMKKILDGDTGAIQEFRESAFTEMTTNVLEDVKESAHELFEDLDGKDKIYDELQNLINLLDDGRFSAEGLRQQLNEIGSEGIGSKAVLSKEYTEALNTMLAQGLLTEQQLNDIFATIGYKPKVTVKSVNQKVLVPIYRTFTQYDASSKGGSIITDQGEAINATSSKTTWTEQIGTKEMTQSIPAVQIDSNKETGMGEIEVVNAGSMNITPSYNSTTSGKASDSSKKDSSSSSNPTTKAASHDHEVNRYSNEENAIKGLSEQYDRLNKAKDKAFGRSRIETIEAEIKKLKALKQASSNYLDAIVGNGNASKVAKALYNGEDIGKMIASGWVGGTARADYNSLFSGLSASGKGLEYTAKDEAGNEWLVSDSYSLSKFNSTFGTNLQFNLDSYGNIQNKDAIYNLLQNLTNTENDAYSKMANPTADSTTEYNKRMALLEEIKERIDQYGKTADLLTEKTDEYLDYISSLQEKNAELITTKMEHGVNLGEKTLQKISRSLKILGDDIYRTAEGMSKWFNLTFEESVKANQQQADAYVEALKDAEQKINLYDQKDGQFNEDAIDPASAAEIFQSIEDGSDRLINDLLNDMEEGKEHFGKTLDYWNEKIERVNSAIEKNGDLLNHFQNILGLLGKNTDYQLMSKVIQGQLDNATSNYNTRKAEAQNAKEVYEKAQRGKEELIQLGVSDEALRVYEENTLQKALEDYQDKADKMYSALEKSIELSNQLFENEVNRIFAESEKRLAGKWGSFDALDSAMQRQQSVAEEYLTKTNQLYETNSMLRKLSQDIDKTDSSIAKAKLKAFSDEIAAMKTQEKLSKTDLEIAKARYEVLQAQIALEEAQNAKSTVRLQRDNEGNYGYVYTADQDKIADAEQKLEDKQNELYNLGLKKAEEYGQKIISIRKEWQAELKKIEEDFQNGIITSEEEYNLIVSDINQKYQALELSYMDTYTKANLLLNETGAEGQTEAWTNSFDEIISTQRVFSDDSESEANQLTNALNEQMNWLNDQREYYTEEAKVGNEELDDSIQEIIDTTKDLEQELIGQNGLVDSMSKTMSVACDLAVKFSNQYDSLKNLVEKYDSAARSAHELYNRTVDLIHAQIALNHANNNASAVSWGNGGTTASYFDGSTVTSSDTNGSSYNAGNGPQIGGDPNTSKITRRFSGITYSYDPKTGKYWAYVNYDEFKDNKWVVRKLERLPDPFDTWSKDDSYIKSTSAYKNLAKSLGFRSGGYTGSWNGLDLEENGKLAFLHQKELVLNADDTENMLSAVKLIRQISQTIDLQAAAYNATTSGFSIGQLANSNQTLQQEVTIHAEFPNATDHNEIEEAFNNLINKATQYVNRY